MKQLALAVHNYHDSNQGLPPASIPITGSEGRPCSWLWRILPFLEQGGALGNTTFADTDFSQRGIDRNWQVTGFLRVKTLECPSNPLPHTYTQTTSSGTRALGAPTTLNVQISDYVGLSGDYTANTTSNYIWNGYHGMSDYNGPIVAIDDRNPQKKTLSSILDGTSNTMLVGEQSNWTYVRDLTTGKTDKYDQRASNWNGGAWSGGGGGNSTEAEAYWMNITSTRVGINYVSTQGRYTPHGIGPYWYGRPGHHSILTSAHPKGAQFALCDGSTRFVSENLNRDTLTAIMNAIEGRAVVDY
jgi:hypothetical protein